MNNNPFENNNSNDGRFNPKPVNSGQAKGTIGKIFGIVLIGISLIATTFAIVSATQEVTEEPEPSTEPYVYKEEDLKLSYTNYKDERFEPFPIEMPKGEDFEILSDSEDFVKTRNYTEAKFVVGNHMEPGIYTVEYIGELPDVKYNLGFTNIYSSQGKIMYNIPLNKGDSIEVEDYTHEANFEIKFTAQTEYVNYEPGFNGFFVYGLNYFEKEVNFKEKQDGPSLNMSVCNKNTLDHCIRDIEELPHQSTPGTYFYVLNDGPNNNQESYE